jgi:hypothetical protein
MWKWVLDHQADLIVAATMGLIFAIVFGLIVTVFFEALELGTRIRGYIRRAKNRLAERSAKQLLARIMEQQTYRNSIASDRGLFVVLFRTMFSVLICILTSGAVLLVTNADVLRVSLTAEEIRVLHQAAFLCLVVGLLSAFTGAKLAKLDTREKTLALIAKLNAEIETMKERLTHLPQPPNNTSSSE